MRNFFAYTGAGLLIGLTLGLAFIGLLTIAPTDGSNVVVPSVVTAPAPDWQQSVVVDHSTTIPPVMFGFDIDGKDN